MYWGYKFKVIPIGSQASVDDPYSSMQNPEAAIWLLERLVNKADLNNGLE